MIGKRGMQQQSDGTESRISTIWSGVIRSDFAISGTMLAIVESCWI